MPSGALTTAVAGPVPLQESHATHDQRGFHTVQECDPLLLPGELHLLPGSLQPQGAHPQVSPSSRVWERVSVAPAIWCLHTFLETLIR